ncbi:P-loop containing nucleoside triphosphate hydrolase protein [Lipomyces oligophaga]|uniref:P-loop containing nucleoside triphosphate hydrolase protein n=1 Tax=Lipomyces oligophaga TaxID=45792 RepID=UPI0034CFDE65
MRFWVVFVVLCSIVIFQLGATTTSTATALISRLLETVFTQSKARMLDDKSKIVIPFILSKFEEFRQRQQHEQQPNGGISPPFFVGLNGVQGVGKTTLVTELQKTLTSEPYSLPIVVWSIDDLYLTHDAQVQLAQTNSDNLLVQHRGEPSTHDMKLANEVFEALKNGRPTMIPRYDKSKFNGQGDRAPSSEWTPVERQVDLVLFEGWCVGFKPLPDQEVEKRWQDSVKEHALNPDSDSQSTLWKHKLEHLLFINSRLREYNIMTDTFDAFVHIDAENTRYVYNWRLQQEAELRRNTGKGMTDAQVVEFVDGYYPAYELYTEGLRKGIFSSSGAQLRLVVARDRHVVSSLIV